MPKRGGRSHHWNDGGERSQGGHHEHDDRREKNVRKVSFKNHPNLKTKHKPWNAALKKLEDDDIDMNDHAVIVSRNNGRNNSNRGNFRGRGRKDNNRVNSPAPRHSFPPKKLIPTNFSWYQVTIPHGQKHEKNFLLKALQTCMSPDPLVPHHYSVSERSAVFYVDDFKTAEKLHSINRKITMPDGYQLGVLVKSGSPQVNINADFLEKMKLAMANRYNAETKALDLTKFHSDPNLTDVFCVLFRRDIMMAALDIICENIPDLEALNLNENKLQSIDNFKHLKRLEKLKILYLANNRIPHINTLETLKGLPLMELFLEGNPLKDRFKETETYVREVQKRFPKLLKLDGAVLPPVIGFDVSDEVNLPASQASFLCKVEGQTIVKQFLQQYFALYDSESRQPLLDAYHENAIFSLSSSYIPGQNQGNPNNRLNAYMSCSRNLLRSQDREMKRKHIKAGRLQVVSFLNDLPKTQHDPHSFTVDLTIFTPTFMMLTINGLFKELIDETSSNKPSSPPIRSFHKTMTIVPFGSGFCIQNDILYITNATSKQEENIFKGPTIIPVTSVAPPNVPPAYNPAVAPPPMPVAPVTHIPPPELKQQFVETLALRTNMNLQWSTDCLEQTNWDLNRAVLVFEQLRKEERIPPEAFIK